MLDERIYLLAMEYLLVTFCVMCVFKIWLDHYDIVSEAAESP